jgi:hypothetical protein
MSQPSPLSLFCNQLIRFFEELSDTFPEERDIKSAIDTLQSARKANPRLLLDMFVAHVVNDMREHIMNEDINGLVFVANKKIQTQFNEIMPALAIFQKHWPTLTEDNRAIIWKYMKVLVTLSDKAQSVRF